MVAATIAAPKIQLGVICGQAKWPTAMLEQIVKCLDYSGEA
jgi:hypothetical protein